MNNFYTILVIPEKTKHLKKIILPSVYVRVGLLLGAVGSFFVAFMVYDYVNVMQQLVENKRLQTENRQLKQQMQTFTTKLQTVQDTLERIQNYKIKLQIITGQTGGGQDVEVLKKRVAPDIPGIPMDDHTDSPATKQRKDQSSLPFPRTNLLASTDPMDTLRLAEDIQKKAQEEAATPVPASEEPVPASEDMLAADPLEQDRRAPQPNTGKKALSDFIREDEERESAALRDEFEKLHLAFGSVLNHARSLELDVQALHSKLIDQKDELASLPTLRPTNGWYTSGFGERNSPFTGKPTMHEGLDIANHVGSAIFAPAVGVVTFAGARPGYGYLITINHGYDTQTQYGHVSKIYVKPGEKVKRGQKIGAVGNTGRSTGPHVHYEVRRNGIPVNPLFHILED